MSTSSSGEMPESVDLKAIHWNDLWKSINCLSLSLSLSFLFWCQITLKLHKINNNTNNENTSVSSQLYCSVAPTCL